MTDQNNTTGTGGLGTRMMSTPAVPLDPNADNAWRGVAAEDSGDISVEVGIKLQARSRRLLGSLLRPHRRLTVLATVMVVISELAFLVGPLIVAYGIDTAVPALSAGNGAPLTFTAIAYLGAGVVNALAKATFVRLSARISQAVLFDLRGRVFTHSQSLSLSFHEKYTSGRVIARMTSDLDTLSDLAEQGLDGLISGVLSVVAISVALLFLDLPLGLIALLAMVPVFLLTRWFQGTSRTIYRRTRAAIASLIVQFTETMNGLRAVLTFRRQGRNAAIFAGFNNENAAANGDGLVALARYTPGVRLVGNLALTAVMIVGAVQVINSQLDIGVLAAFLLYVRRMYDPLDELAMFYNSYQSAAAALEKLSGLLEEVPSVPEPVDPVPLPDVTGHVRFEQVEFSYHPDVPVLPTFDLDLPAGQTLAVVGATGAGKSTLAKLLARFYDPTAGRVLLDDVDVSHLSTADLRRGVVMVTQESFLFSGSVADNIALGKPEATRAEIEAAADEIGAGDFIRALPDGFDTDVRKRGGRLSAGQRQLVGFARAFLADPAVLILDEATASLDIPSERAVQAALRTVLHNRTAVIIAHRLSTVEIADRVLVMEHGRIAEDGRPADLIGGGGRFAGLHTAWQDSLV
ncbi:ABC-type multidrug transport system, ATPase and permease component [Nakamurella panacisegetis]|uniref:ABC-type multidrug transport system, ATPase and permease component n=2 Tax=Nakamurella panacisegetis TaxID=1090615 RepID=A0A1H0J2N3_9ACTN|nr:ABC transporter ATP-binding protein [Nakamurella panacisegetis]SDO38058.1 ABC-type multidrug transport system, ATPase and permease component [Nakamurella panacisegetis]